MEPRRRCLYQMSLRQKHQELYRPIDYIKKYLGGDIPHDGLYEASQNIACVKDDKYFVNQQIGTYREFQGRPGVVPNLFEIGNSAIVSEGISLALDINNRYQYIYQNLINHLQ